MNKKTPLKSPLQTTVRTSPQSYHSLPIFLSCLAFIVVGCASTSQPTLKNKEARAISDLLLGKIALKREDYKVAAKSFESITSSNYNEEYALKCIDAATKVQDYKTANKCFEILKNNFIQDNAKKELATPSSVKTTPTNHEQSIKTIEALDTLEAVIIATSYDGDFAGKFLEKINKFDDPKKQSIITQSARSLTTLRLYDRAVIIFRKLVDTPNMVGSFGNKILLADFLLHTWEDEQALKLAAESFTENPSPISLLIYVEALQLNGQMDKAFELLAQHQDKPKFVNSVLRTQLTKIPSLEDENRLRDFLTDRVGVLKKNISPQIKVNFISRWFELEEFTTTRRLLKPIESEVVKTRSPELISLFIYLKGISDLELAANEKEAEKARELLARITRNPRFTQLIKTHEIGTRIKDIGINKYIDEVNAKAKIIMAPADYLNIAHTLHRKNHVDVALQTLENGLVFHENEVSMLYEAALYSIELEHKNKMEGYLQRIIEIDPNNYQAHNALGYTWADQNRNLSQAKNNITTALSHQPLEPIILDSYGWYFFRAGDNAKSLEFLNRALRLQHDPEIAAHLIEVLITVAKNGGGDDEINKANSLYKQALSLYNQYPERDSSIRGLKIINAVAKKFNLPISTISTNKK